MIHRTAIIEEGAVIGENVKVGAYSVIGKNVTIGDNNEIGAHVVIEGRTTIGNGNKIFPYASIGQAPQDLKYNGEDTELIIGDNNLIREFVTLNLGTLAAQKTVIGNGNLFMAYVHVAHDVIIENGCVFANAATLAGHVEIGENVVVGGLSAVHQFCKIGANAMLGGGSIVVQDIAPFTIVEGNRAKVRGLNLTGLKRRGFTKEEISNLKNAYKKVFMSKIKLETALEDLLKEYPEDKNIKYFVDTIKTFERGLTR